MSTSTYLYRGVYFNLAGLLTTAAFSMQANISVAQSNEISLTQRLEHYAILNPKYVKTYETDPAKIRSQIKDLEPFWKARTTILEEIENQRTFRKSVSMSFNTDNANGQDDQRLSLGFDIRRGTYPGEFELKSDLVLEYKSGVVTENVSNVFLSYDYNLNYYVEPFLFVNRFSDTYLSIDHRYEIGGGIVFGNWLKVCRLKKKKEIEIDKTLFPKDANTIQQCPWYPYYKTRMAPPDENDLITAIAADMKSIKEAVDDVDNARYKKYSWLRLGILFGVFAEVEQPGVLTGSECFDDGHPMTLPTPDTSGSFLSHTMWRASIRPTLELRPSPSWRISLKPYLKVKQPWKDRFTIDYTGNRVHDYRWDIFISNKVELPRANLQRNTKVAVSIEYRYHYDNMPHAYEVSENCFLVARKSHHVLRTSFGITF